jgi:hypothetical protein
MLKVPPAITVPFDVGACPNEPEALATVKALDEAKKPTPTPFRYEGWTRLRLAVFQGVLS